VRNMKKITISIFNHAHIFYSYSHETGLKLVKLISVFGTKLNLIFSKLVRSRNGLFKMDNLDYYFCLTVLNSVSQPTGRDPETGHGRFRTGRGFSKK